MSELRLLDSGTTRSHFQLVKRLEDAADDTTRDAIICETVQTIRNKLATTSSDPAASASSLLTLLHCLEHYPHSPQTTESLDVSFSLLPTLQLVSLASRWSDLLVGYGMLRFLIPSSISSQPSKSESNDDAGSASALLLLNTYRKHLIDADRQRQTSSTHHNLGRTSATLSSVAVGIPSGAVVLPSLATPLLKLTHHPKAHIRKEALNAMWRCSQYEQDDQENAESIKGDGEMIQATLQAVKDMIASPLALVPDAEPEASIKRIQARVESDPSVLRAAVRVIDLSRDMGATTAQEATHLLVCVLQSIEWAPGHLDLGESLAGVPVGTRTKLDTIRGRSAAKARSTTASDYEYHGLQMPWTVIACLESLIRSTSTTRPPLAEELEKAVLRIYIRASQGVDAALAICVSAARLLGQLHTQDTVTDGEAAALWNAASQHVKAQLLSSNANRKVVAVDLLSALLPIGWTVPSDSAIFTLDEDEMGTLMALLGDRDQTVRRGTLRLLHRIDSNLIQMHLEQLQKTIKETDPTSLSGKQLGRLAVRTLEAAYLNVTLSSGSVDDYAEVVSRVFAALPASAENALELAIDQVLCDYRGLEVALEATLAVRLVSDGAQSESLRRLSATLLCDTVPPASSDLLSRLVDILVAAEGEKTRDAVLAAIVRTASQDSAEPSLAGRIRKIAEATSSSLVAKTRLESVAALVEQQDKDVLRAFAAPGLGVDGILELVLHQTAAKDSQADRNENSPGVSSKAMVRPLSAAKVSAPSPNSRAKRQRDARIQSAMSASIARLVLGADDDGEDQGTEVIFSADDEADSVVSSHSDADMFAPIATGDSEPTLLDLVHQCHNHDPWRDATLTPFILDGVQIGFLPPNVVQACEEDIRFRSSDPVLRFVPWGKERRRALTFASHITGYDARTAAIAKVAERWRDNGTFPDPLEGKSSAYLSLLALF